MIRLLQILALIFLLRFLWRAVSQLLSGTESRSIREETRGRKKSNLIYGGQMVRDPVCGVYVPLDRSVRERDGDEVRYFCSDSCRERYRRQEVPAP